MTLESNQQEAPGSRNPQNQCSTVKTLTTIAFVTLASLISGFCTADTLEPHENILATATQTILEMPEVRSLSNPSIKPNNLDNRLRLTRCSEPLSRSHKPIHARRKADGGCRVPRQSALVNLRSCNRYLRNPGPDPPAGSSKGCHPHGGGCRCSDLATSADRPTHTF